MSVPGFPRTGRIVPITMLGFIVEKAPLPLNATYATRSYVPKERRNDPTVKPRGFMYMTPEADEHKAVIRRAGTMALATHKSWPKDLWAPSHVRISVYPHNVKSDAGANAKLVSDAFEGILYENDSVVSFGELLMPDHNGGNPCFEVIVDLLAVRAPRDARILEMEHLKRRLARAIKVGDNIARLITEDAIGKCKRALIELY